MHPICVMKSQKERQEIKTIKEIIARNFMNLMRNSNVHIKEA